ncbi:hypothetical protein [Caulobacter sp. Root1472]|uniref:hypothetical protein n=1 Tax=Caulobacter sp. Root1472 TaxID=1736470 RepID=UPI000700B099|nr:hypothetical protein [Caulobacter sp. Root1472]KQZ17970.1 hypothetical protein ASD47_10980 [Caulobacter sp. Root1472]
MFGGYAALLIIGGIQSTYGGVEQPKAAILATILDAKLFVFVFGLCAIMNRLDRPVDIFRVLFLTMIGIAIINLPFVVLDLLRGVDLHGDTLLRKSSLPLPRGLFHHHTELAWLYCIAAFGTYTLFQLKNNVRLLALTAVFAVAVLLTVSIKEIVGLGIGLIIISGKAKRGGHLGTALIAISIVAAATAVLFTTGFGAAILNHASMFVGGHAIPNVRAGMTEASWMIANQHFPLGSGGGTFGSAPSYQGGYSEVYYAYGINTLYGGSREYSGYLQDVFWPKIVGEGGWIGFALYAGFLLLFVQRLIAKPARSSQGDPLQRFSLAIVVLVFVVSTASAPFTNELLIFFMALALGYGSRARHLVTQRNPRPRAQEARA